MTPEERDEIEAKIRQEMELKAIRESVLEMRDDFRRLQESVNAMTARQERLFGRLEELSRSRNKSNVEIGNADSVVSISDSENVDLNNVGNKTND